METLGDRVSQRRSELKISQSELAKRITKLGEQITQQGIGTIETRGDVRPRYMAELAKALQTSQEWLLTGRGDKASSGIVTNQGVPEIDVRAGAGGGGVAISLNTTENGITTHVDEVKDHWGIPDSYIRGDLRTSPRHVKIVEIMGDSMAPTLTSGDRVLIDTKRTTPSPPGIYAIWDGMGVIVKRIEVIAGSDPVSINIISDNEHHKPFTLELENAVIIGMVVCRVSVL